MHLRQHLIDAGLWHKEDTRDPTYDISLAWQLVSAIAVYYPEIHEAFVNELPPRLIFAMYADGAAYNICRAALIAKTGIDPTKESRLGR